MSFEYFAGVCIYVSKMDGLSGEYVDTEYLDDFENANLDQLSSISYRDEHPVEELFQPENHQHSGSGNALDPANEITEEQIEPSGSGFVIASHHPEDQNLSAESDPLIDETGHGVAKDKFEDCLFFFKATFHRRLYRNQLRPREVLKRDVGANSVPELLNLLWAVSKKYVHRQVVFNNEEPRWSDKVEPSQEDLSSFVTLQDPSKRKTYLVNSLTPRVITTWRGRCIKVHIYVYSTSLETNTQYQSVLRILTAPRNADRAGAHSTKDDTMVANDLRESHKVLEGHHSSWLLWANFINSSPAHKHEQLKNAASPPIELAKYFRWTGVSEAARLQSVHRGMNVANTVNDGWMNEIRVIKKDLTLAMSILQGVAQRIDAMELRGSVGAELFTAMEAAVRPEESDLSVMLAARVTDCEDNCL
ncbi:uncharacterized protein LOC134209442 [Armigeres subalbatus]|uniref:uncharacterized protein LOC134209442 n=1 Tax=Armigeres subalbatus TaxID=124917 RepID=UPI002ED45808